VTSSIPTVRGIAQNRVQRREAEALGVRLMDNVSYGLRERADKFVDH